MLVFTDFWQYDGMDLNRKKRTTYTLSTLSNTHMQPTYQEMRRRTRTFSWNLLSNRPRGAPRDELRSLHLCPIIII